ncbi:hypothetical protein ACJ41O_008782 [Fusarium nematophilum]
MVPPRKRRRPRSLDGNDTEFDHHGLHRQPRSGRITRSRAATDCALAAGGAATGRSRRDFLSPLPNELAIRILSNLSAWELLDVSLVSKQLSAWASSPQLWRGLYYRCFVLPNAGSIFQRRPDRGGDESVLYSSVHDVEWVARGGSLVSLPRDELDGESAGGGVRDADWKRDYRNYHS